MAGKGYKVHLRGEEVELLTIVARHRMMDQRALAQDILSLGILREVEKLRSVYGDDWKKKITEKSKGKKYE